MVPPLGITGDLRLRVTEDLRRYSPLRRLDRWLLQPGRGPRTWRLYRDEQALHDEAAYALARSAAEEPETRALAVAYLVDLPWEPSTLSMNPPRVSGLLHPPWLPPASQPEVRGAVASRGAWLVHRAGKNLRAVSHRRDARLPPPAPDRARVAAERDRALALYARLLEQGPPAPALAAQLGRLTRFWTYAWLEGGRSEAEAAAGREARLRLDRRALAALPAGPALGLRLDHLRQLLRGRQAGRSLAPWRSMLELLVAEPLPAETWEKGHELWAEGRSLLAEDEAFAAAEEAPGRGESVAELVAATEEGLTRLEETRAVDARGRLSASGTRPLEDLAPTEYHALERHLPELARWRARFEAGLDPRRLDEELRERMLRLDTRVYSLGWPRPLHPMLYVEPGDAAPDPDLKPRLDRFVESWTGAPIVAGSSGWLRRGLQEIHEMYRAEGERRRAEEAVRRGEELSEGWPRVLVVELQAGAQVRKVGGASRALALDPIRNLDSYLRRPETAAAVWRHFRDEMAVSERVAYALLRSLLEEPEAAPAAASLLLDLVFEPDDLVLHPVRLTGEAWPPLPRSLLASPTGRLAEALRREWTREARHELRGPAPGRVTRAWLEDVAAAAEALAGDERWPLVGHALWLQAKWLLVRARSGDPWEPDLGRLRAQLAALGPRLPPRLALHLDERFIELLRDHGDEVGLAGVRGWTEELLERFGSQGSPSSGKRADAARLEELLAAPGP